MKIVYIVSTLKNSGPINILYNIIKYLEVDKKNIVIITLSPEDKLSRYDDFDNLSVNIHQLNLSRLKGLFFLKNTVQRLIDDIQPDIIHSHGLRPDALAFSFSNQFSIVSTIHNFPYADYTLKFGKVKGFLMATKHCSIIKNYASNVVACSRSIADEFLLRKDVRISFIQNGVDLSIYKALIHNKDALRRKLKLPTDKKIFISVGSLIARKNMSTVIKGFKKSLSNKDSGSLLLIAGDGTDFDALSELTKDSSDIYLLGNINNVKEYLNASDYFISASHSEGLPNTVLEAMACGLPVVLSHIPSHLEVLDSRKDIEFLFQKNSINELAQKINELKKLDYDDYSLKFIAVIENNFSAENMSKKYHSLYLKLIARRKC